MTVQRSARFPSTWLLALLLSWAGSTSALPHGLDDVDHISHSHRHHGAQADHQHPIDASEDSIATTHRAHSRPYAVANPMHPAPSAMMLRRAPDLRPVSEPADRAWSRTSIYAQRVGLLLHDQRTPFC